jgi:hypothetical protein
MASSAGQRWFQTRQRYDPGDFILEEIWSPLLYAIDVSCGGWQCALMVRRAFEQLGRDSIAALSGWQQLQAIAAMMAQAYQKAYQALNLPLPDEEIRREQICSAMGMIWELPDDWQFSLEPFAASMTATPGAEPSASQSDKG